MPSACRWFICAGRDTQRWPWAHCVFQNPEWVTANLRPLKWLLASSKGCEDDHRIYPNKFFLLSQSWNQAWLFLFLVYADLTYVPIFTMNSWIGSSVFCWGGIDSPLDLLCCSKLCRSSLLSCLFILGVGLSGRNVGRERREQAS